MHEALERGFLRLVMATGICAWLALAAAEAGVFRSWFVVLGAAAGAALWVRVERRSAVAASPPADNRASADETGVPTADGEPHGHARSGGWLSGTALSGALLAGLVLIAAFRFLPPFDTTLWAGDSSVYMSYARQIERSGSLVFEDPMVTEIPRELRRELFLNRELGDVTGQYTRFSGGFLIADIEQSRVTAGFAPVYPLLVALAQGIFGPRAGLFVAPLFAILAVAALFFVGWRLAGLVGGMLAGGLLALSMPQVWFARFGMPAVVAQLFVFAGLLALLVARERRRPALAAAGGFLFGMAVFTKFDLLFVLSLAATGFAAWALWRGAGAGEDGSRRRDDGRIVAAFCAAFALLLAHNALHYLVFPSHYEPFVEHMVATLRARLMMGQGGGGAAWMLLLIGALIATAASLAWLMRGARGRVAGVAGAVLLVLALGYGAAYLAVSTNRVAETVGWLAWYLSWPMLVLVVLALMAWSLYRRRRAERAVQETFLIILLAAAATHYVYDPHEAPRLIWSMRRFVPVVIPAALLVAAVFVAVAAKRVPLRGRPWLIAAAALTGGVLVGAPSLTLIGTQPWRGASEQLREAACSFPPGAVVLLSDDLAGTHIGTALTYLYDTDAIVARPSYSRPAVLQELATGLLRRGREVYLVLGSDFHLAGPRLALERRHDLEFRLPVLETTASRPPQETVVLTADLVVFRVSERPEQPRAYVDVGNRVEDTLFEMSGLHAAERDETTFDGSFRWTDGQAVISVPPARRLELLLDGARPEGVGPAVVSIWIGDRRVVDDVTLADAPQIIRIDNPLSDGGRRVRLNIASTAFVPSDIGLSTDSRRLGVRLYGVRLVPPACCDD